MVTSRTVGAGVLAGVDGETGGDDVAALDGEVDGGSGVADGKAAVALAAPEGAAGASGLVVAGGAAAAVGVGAGATVELLVLTAGVVPGEQPTAIAPASVNPPVHLKARDIGLSSSAQATPHEGVERRLYPCWVSAPTRDAAGLEGAPLMWVVTSVRLASVLSGYC
jgi:hypothetical protein